MQMPAPMLEYSRESIEMMSEDRHFDDMFPDAAQAAALWLRVRKPKDLLYGFLVACDGIDDYTRARAVMPGYLVWEYLAWREQHASKAVREYMTTGEGRHVLPHPA